MILTKEKYSRYLEQLRSNGIKSAMGAVKYLEKAFNISNSEAKKIIREYNREHAFYD